MTFLVLDTSGASAVLALANDETGDVTASAIFESRRTLSRRLMGQLDALLQANALTLDDLSAFAVGLGPGSFTGVRVGVTTAKTLAQVTGKPLIGVGTLDAYAVAWGESPSLIVPVLPSRRGEVYAAIYRAGQTQQSPFAIGIEPMTSRLAELSSRETVIICGDPGLLGETSCQTLHQPWAPPDGLARLAVRRLLAGDSDDPLALVPLYVVAPSISVPKDVPRPLAASFEEQAP